MSGFRGPLFVVGMPRSGTKLLRGLLDNHSRIAIPTAETELLPYWSARWPEFGDLSEPDAFDRFYEDALGSPYFSYMKKHRGRCVTADEWRAACSSLTPAGVFEALVKLDTGCDDEMIWGDKSPGYIRHLPLLLELYPQGRIVHIVRDVRDHCLSIHQAWRKNMIRAAQRWNDDVGAACRVLAEHPDRSLQVRFEDLLENPGNVLERICGFLDLELEPEMLRLTNATENIGDAQGAHEVVAGNKEKWRTRLPEAQIRRIETICRGTLEEHGYPVSYDGPVKRVHPWKMEAYKLADGFNLVRNDNHSRGFLRTVLLHLRHSKETAD